MFVQLNSNKIVFVFVFVSFFQFSFISSTFKILKFLRNGGKEETWRSLSRGKQEKRTLGLCSFKQTYLN